MHLRVLALLAAATLAACSGSGAGSAGGDTIKIGVDLPVSGADASIGIPTQNGAVQAIEEANAAGFAGGKFKLAAYLLDDVAQGRHDPAAGAQNVKAFISDAELHESSTVGITQSLGDTFAPLPSGLSDNRASIL